MKLDPITQYILEGFLLSDKTLFADISKFKEGKNRVLFITGVCGSGKSTLAKKLSKRLKVKNYELDEVWKIVVKKYKYDSGDNPFTLYFSELKKAVPSIKGRAIIEGAGLMYIWDDFLKQKYMNNSSFIIIGTSQYVGTWRQLIRNVKGTDPYWKDVEKMILNWIDHRNKEDVVEYGKPWIRIRKMSDDLQKTNKNIVLKKSTFKNNRDI